MEYPKLRYVDAFPVETEQGKMIGLRDPSGISPQMLLLSPDVFYLLQFFDGRHSVIDLQREYLQTFGKLIYEKQLRQMLQNLDANLLLDNDNFYGQLRAIEDAFLASPARPAVHAGSSYESDPEKLREQMRALFEASEGPGMPDLSRATRPPKALVAPHIDIRAGGACYAHAYKVLGESEGADCFVILGTGHSGLRNLYSTVAKDFETPLGKAKCDAGFINALQENYPAIVNSEALPHRTEHVIEFQLVFLQYLLGGRQDFTFVPVLCSFSYQMLTEPRFKTEQQIIQDFSGALRETIAQYGGTVCLIASVDFCHIGPRYGDPESPDAAFMKRVATFDRAMIDTIERWEPKAFCDTLAACEDRYRVCGFSSLYTMMNAVDADKAELLDYSSAIMDKSQSTVTFASMAAY